jgi:hypothetical protein
MNKKHIERVLKINGVSSTASDDEIRSVLSSARYRDEEIAQALTILHGAQESTNNDRTDGLHRVFRTDTVLSSAEVSKLLGIDIKVSTIDPKLKRSIQRALSPSEHILIVLLSFMLAVGGVLFAMRVMEFGVFHPTAALLIYDQWK